MERCSRFLRSERRKMYYWVGTFCCVVGVLVFLLILFNIVAEKNSFVPNFVGGYCAIFATVLSLFLILEHLTCFADPECQTKVVRIVFMVPIFAMISWISLLAPSAAEYLNLVRDTYESYAIYSFFQLMIALMGGVDTLYRALMIEEHPAVRHIFPFCYMSPIKVTPTFVQNCRLCLFQFMVVKPVVSLIVIILTTQDKMGSGLLDVTGGYFWTTLVYNLSITIAFTALLYFLHRIKGVYGGEERAAEVSLCQGGDLSIFLARYSHCLS
ncbi:f2o10.10 protein-like protein [Angomonas deanei]|uniref:Organic solute transporter Ostalpha, putative n=1 Tax=Angomonas deanei TaxID=59799 RepID=S9VIT4_9TRYP|nr:f2o10.10 protein-like protein [Angomonas deanei]EPY40793.1 f2o10.10 protein-like protein [Angomonas deanei]CAD2213298.1 Organic solute transporter Ostalpha, putative [Angomonas deanei]|eukprot:EPY26975.1 f2o10.10 protein-like protein [Angomonas deanei]